VRVLQGRRSLYYLLPPARRRASQQSYWPGLYPGGYHRRAWERWGGGIGFQMLWDCPLSVLCVYLRSLIDYNFIRWAVIGTGISHTTNVGIAHFFHMSAAPWTVRIEDVVRSVLPWKWLNLACQISADWLWTVAVRGTHANPRKATYASCQPRACSGAGYPGTLACWPTCYLPNLPCYPMRQSEAKTV